MPADGVSRRELGADRAVGGDVDQGAAVRARLGGRSALRTAGIMDYALARAERFALSLAAQSPVIDQLLRESVGIVMAVGDHNRRQAVSVCPKLADVKGGCPMPTSADN